MGKNKVSILIICLITLVIIAGVVLVNIYSTPEEKEKENETNTVKVEEELEKEETEEDVENELGIDDEEKENLEKEAKKTLKEYLPLSIYEKNTVGPMPYILAKLGLETSANLELLCTTEPNVYIKSDVKYDDFKNALLEYVTEDYFEVYFAQYKNMDGYVGFYNKAVGVSVSEVESIELIGVEDGEYTFNVEFKDVEIYEHYVDGDEYIKEGDWIFYNDVIFKYENDKLVISEFTNGEIILEGVYAYEASDVGYIFNSNGTVERSGNITSTRGTYVTIGENELQLIFTEIGTWDIENGVETIEEIYEVEKIKIVDETKLIVEYEFEGQTHTGEITKNDIE